MADKPKSKRTVKEWDSEIRRLSEQVSRLEILVGDILHGSPAHAGSPVTAHVSSKESSDKRTSFTAVIYRPLGADPTVIVIYTVKGERPNVGVYRFEDWRTRAEGDPYEVALLKERARLEYTRANHPGSF